MSYPFSIAALSLEGAGRIGVCGLPGLFGDPASDLAAIVAWKPDIVVSMTEQSEMDEVGMGNFGAPLAAARIEWRRLPIRDFSGPEGTSKEAWPALAAHLHAILDRGGAVLLHCRGGRGRSGMIALRLLVERGEEAEAALARLRTERPGAVETSGQFTWASQGKRRG